MGVYVRYDLIGQRPDENYAFRPEYHSDFQAGGSAFSASTIRVPLDYNLDPMQWVMAEVIMTARSEECAIRFRRYEWVQRDGVWSQDSVPAPELKPDILNAPRTVTQHITDIWSLPSNGPVHYVLETKGIPVIYGAYIHGVTKDKQVTTTSVDLSAIINACKQAGKALSNI